MNQTESPIQEGQIIDQKLEELFSVICQMDNAKNRLSGILFASMPMNSDVSCDPDSGAGETLASVLNRAIATIDKIADEVNYIGNELCKYVGKVKIA